MINKSGLLCRFSTTRLSRFLHWCIAAFSGISGSSSVWNVENTQVGDTGSLTESCVGKQGLTRHADCRKCVSALELIAQKKVDMHLTLNNKQAMALTHGFAHGLVQSVLFNIRYVCVAALRVLAAVLNLWKAV